MWISFGILTAKGKNEQFYEKKTYVVATVNFKCWEKNNL